MQTQNFSFALAASVLALGLCIGTGFSLRAEAAPLRCSPMSEVFENDLALMNLEKKLSTREFADLPMTPSGSIRLKKGTELNVLVDTGCLRDPGKGPQRLKWLKEVANRFHDGAHWRQHRSFQWQLDREW
ncbi:MAG: hypothetical protein V4692_13170, partial [Bdellovibrionota bacterium]